MTGRAHGPYVQEGDALGQMKREHVGRLITEAIFAGPKNYALQHEKASDGSDRRANVKIRSFRLTYSTDQLLNFESIKTLLREYYNIDGERYPHRVVIL